ncbi:lipoprotein [Caballeronia arationis]|jgi:lipid-binding SYLF domain-containing protein|uniref:Lipid-binding SYLF domain-containing protein n=1 Tax=Caballeronia arationis TaxID=1777142 RepID=A0A7Z7I1E4_9BURK|nr:YSC84-related protein [Caballeronia arationis]SAL06804.1 lipoprotein [Caballeronia arationis]SOE50213.1 Lipid-binding SYLF domain-containing protein [Caballeronia arationis]
MHRRTFFFSLTAIALASSLAACGSTSNPTEAANKRQEIDAGVDGALNKLYSATPGAREQGSKAKGILVFPSVIAAGLVVGGEYGEGALRAGGTSIGYYKTSTASFGLQIGAQSKVVVLMFMTQDALDKFRTSDKGWTAGVDGSVAVAKSGANGALDTATTNAPIVGFVLTNSGLMANLSFEGTKVSKLGI